METAVVTTFLGPVNKRNPSGFLPSLTPKDIVFHGFADLFSVSLGLVQHRFSGNQRHVRGNPQIIGRLFLLPACRTVFDFGSSRFHQLLQPATAAPHGLQASVPAQIQLRQGDVFKPQFLQLRQLAQFQRIQLVRADAEVIITVFRAYC